MSLVNFTAFLPEVLPFVHDCPQSVAVNAIRNAAIEFCSKTRYWQQDMDAVTVIPNVADYDIDTPKGTVLVGVQTLFYNGRQIKPKSKDELAALYPHSDWRQTPGVPHYFTEPTLGVVTLAPYPTDRLAGGLTGVIALAPSRTATQCDSELLERYIEQIGLGARARLYGIVGQPFYDPNLEELYKSKFKSALVDATNQVNMGRSRAGLRVRYNKWA